MTSDRRSIRVILKLVPGILYCGAISSAVAQNAPNKPATQNQPGTTSGLEKQVNAGPLQPPAPYAGTKTIGNPPVVYTGSPHPTDPLTYWRSRIIGTGNGCGTTVIIVSGAPCYVPLYYGLGGYPGAYFGDSGYFANLQRGILQFGFGQNNFGFNQAYNGIGAPGSGVYSRQNALGSTGLSPLQQRAEARRAAEREKKAQEASQSEEDTYYLNQKPKAKSPLDKDPALAQAVADIVAAYRTGDASRMERHVSPTDTLTLQSKGHSRTPLAGATYIETTRDALKHMRTSKYVLDKVEPASGGAWMVYGTHVLIGEDGKDRTFNISFVLKKRGEVYMISEVSGDLAK